MYRANNNEKIGNLLIYLASQVSEFGLTKALKILFLLDEQSMNETGVPVTWLEYKAWQYGPVANELYYEIRHDEKTIDEDGERQSLSEYIKVKHRPDLRYETYMLSPVKEFEDDEFSDYEIDLMDRIIMQFGDLTAKELTDLTHAPGSKWDQVSEKENLKSIFDYGAKTSDQTINLFPEDFSEEKLMAYVAARDGMEAERILKKNRKRSGNNRF